MAILQRVYVYRIYVCSCYQHKNNNLREVFSIPNYKIDTPWLESFECFKFSTDIYPKVNDEIHTKLPSSFQYLAHASMIN